MLIQCLTPLSSFQVTSAVTMSRERADSQGSLGPDDEVMPYSDDETDDELDPGDEEMQGHLGPPGAPGAAAAPSGQLMALK